ncbi:MAG: hypothetical protein IPI06_16040 [Gammaproteobacteria bacterium]|nr:hypothetical protein [Gammaproteobacteria bacterium]
MRRHWTGRSGIADIARDPRRERAPARRRLIGIGIANTVEPGVFDWNAYAIVGMNAIGIRRASPSRLDAFGRITARVGFTSEGKVSTP